MLILSLTFKDIRKAIPALIFILSCGQPEQADNSNDTLSSNGSTVDTMAPHAGSSLRKDRLILFMLIIKDDNAAIFPDFYEMGLPGSTAFRQEVMKVDPVPDSQEIKKMPYKAIIVY